MTLQKTKEKLMINNNGTKIKSKQLNPAIPSTYLGDSSQPNGLQEGQYKILTKLEIRISRKLTTCPMSYYLTHTYYQ